MKINKKLIKELNEILKEFNLSEIEYGEKDLRIKVVKNNTNKLNNFEIKSEAIPRKETETKITNKNEVSSPLIGTAYLAPEPGAKKFVEEGKKIKKGDTVMIVEAMKTMNHVPSPFDGVVKKVCVEDGQPVEFGQTLIIVD